MSNWTASNGPSHHQHGVRVCVSYEDNEETVCVCVCERIIKGEISTERERDGWKGVNIATGCFYSRRAIREEPEPHTAPLGGLEVCVCVCVCFCYVFVCIRVCALSCVCVH